MRGFSEVSNQGPEFLRVLKLKCSEISEDFFTIFIFFNNLEK